MPVYHAYTRDGVRFDGCVALDEKNAKKIIEYRYSRRRDERHFVGGKDQSTKELISGMLIRHIPHIPEAVQLMVEQRAEEEAAVRSNKTLTRLASAVDDMQNYG